MSDLAESLEEWMQSSSPVEDRFKIEDDGGAEWALRRLAKLEERARGVKLLAEEEREKLKMWEESELHRLESDGEHLRDLLREYHTRLLLEDDRRRTVRLPHGTMAIRKLPDKWEIDPDAFLIWAKANAPALVKVVELPKLAEAKQALKPLSDLSAQVPGSVTAAVSEDGEIVPGVVIERQADRWSVTVES